MLRWLLLVSTLLLASLSAFPQTPTATIDGRVLDASKAVIEGATVETINVDTNVKYAAHTNANGLFSIVNLPPGNYRIEVTKPGFRSIVKPDIVLHVQDVIALNFEMSVGSILESVTVEGGAPLVDSESAAVGTVVDRNFAENLPMNGRSFQTLIGLTPGVVSTTSNFADGGQFSINGQRASSNYWMVDGVSANIGVSAFVPPGNGLGGALGSFSTLGGTNSLVSVDALEEFKLLTSGYAPEFGRTPGGQISIITRSGTNQLHGTLFDYLRNDIFDANDWFANFHHLRKPEERQNDFGGTLSGPILKNRTFFFFSYEGLRLRLPAVGQSIVPDLAARSGAPPALQPFLAAFPVPNGANLGSGIATFNASFSNAAGLDAYSLRLDHKLSQKINLFGRYDYSPSDLLQRGLFQASLSSPNSAHITTDTLTVGTTAAISPLVFNDLRFNYSRTDAANRYFIDDFGGAVAPTTLPLPDGFTANNGQFIFNIESLGNNCCLTVGSAAKAGQRQFNVVDSLSVQAGSHDLKFGVDFRHLGPFSQFAPYAQDVAFSDVPSADAGSLSFSFITASALAKLRFKNLGAFAQDTWKVIPRLTLTYGLRWDVDFAPSSRGGPGLVSVTGFDLNDLSTLALAPAGTPPFKTRYNNLAPRLGIAYEMLPSQNWETVFRGGVGVFYDLATSEAGNDITRDYPFGANAFTSGGSFPLDAATAAPPPITTAQLASGQLSAFDPNLRLPYSIQWNIALQQGLGQDQTLSASYIGSAGKRLIQSAYIIAPNATFGAAQLTTNSAESDYDALQLQFQRRLAHGVQALASYTWSHSIDDASAGSALGNLSNALAPGFDPRVNRGPSDFDLRHAFSAGITYNFPARNRTAFEKLLLRGWSTENFIQAHSGYPVTPFYSAFFDLANGALANVRPDFVSGQPLYVHGQTCVNTLGPPCAGGKGFNPAAFAAPPIDANTGSPLRQGTLPRNALRGYGAWQWDFAVHREFPIAESLRLQFRAELFNVLNHPNFAPPVADLGAPQSLNPQFGQAMQMLGQSLNGGSAGSNLGGGAFSPLYQLGGPRSIQLALKLTF